MNRIFQSMHLVFLDINNGYLITRLSDLELTLYDLGKIMVFTLNNNLTLLVHFFQMAISPRKRVIQKVQAYCAPPHTRYIQKP